MAKVINAGCKACKSKLRIDIEQKTAFCPYCGERLIDNGKSIGLDENFFKNLFTKESTEFQSAETIIPNNSDVSLFECICQSCQQIAVVDISKKEAYCGHCGKKVIENGEMTHSVPKDMKGFFKFHKKKLRIAGVAVLIFILCFAVACESLSKIGNKSYDLNKNVTSQVQVAQVSMITAKKSALELKVGDTETIDFTVYADGEISEADLISEIEDSKIVSVTDLTLKENAVSYTATVTITAKDVGDTTLLLTDAFGEVQSKTVEIAVKSDIEEISFIDTSINLTVDESKQVSAIITPDGIRSDEINITATDATILGIKDIKLTDENGCTKVTFTANGLSKGNTTIRIQSMQGDENALIFVVVTEKPTEAPTDPPQSYQNENSDDRNYTDGASNEDFSDYYDQIVYLTATGDKYHTQGCRFAKQSGYPVTLREAVEMGYEPCQVCH